MIVVDCSALLAILFDEPEKQAFEDAIGGAERCLISAVNAHEAATVLRAMAVLLLSVFGACSQQIKLR
jgi:ribonuclease VapC